eukprot:TRINITY_DN76_c0_g1_i1.p1 TRINITY_DN76_c0_g1~~TRINITY_DN76_c0_g1_i1.p1  ORF type:complete len:118 (-),score=58.29 TRINITY_DN76_c0_g1_i1:61-414(-)
MASKKTEENFNEEQIIQHYQELKIECKSLLSKINELELEKNEHDLVIGSIEKLDPSRRCYRLVGGVLVERTVGEIAPAVKSNRDKIEQVIEQISLSFDKKESELNTWIDKYKIRVQT